MAEEEQDGRRVGNHNRTLKDDLQPARTSSPSCIIQSLNANNFNFKPGMIPLIPHFHGMQSENPYLHIKEFEEVCSTFMDQTCAEEVIRLKLFHFSLKDKAKTWLNSLRPRSIGTWQEMQTEFLKKFFPMHRTNALKRQIMNFAQKDTETFYQCWGRFKDLLNACPHHTYENWRIISFFYEGLQPKMRQFVETMYNGEFFNKEPEEAFEYFDYLSENAQSWDVSDAYDRTEPLKITGGGKYNLREVDDLHARVSMLSKKLETIDTNKVNEVQVIQKIPKKCNICEEIGHVTSDCPTIPAFKEVLLDQSNSVNFISKSFPASLGPPQYPAASHFGQRRNLEETVQQMGRTLQQFMQGQAAINTQNAQTFNDIRRTLTKISATLSI
ncbi:hypothetical protein F2P56_012835 [Juglans regia]|uniref:Retrotransposon gag domain-containing protein n=2 Tax=Juglans regia TaxID=51240 RepID=A0A834CRC7_JUGRE|nr:uncharacterized protein LOC108994281 [Juglans regia]KAF5468699.1 hypothetical protein F2P56_012835 [Juglans regia]